MPLLQTTEKQEEKEEEEVEVVVVDARLDEEVVACTGASAPSRQKVLHFHNFVRNLLPMLGFWVGKSSDFTNPSVRCGPAGGK